MYIQHQYVEPAKKPDEQAMSSSSAVGNNQMLILLAIAIAVFYLMKK